MEKYKKKVNEVSRKKNFTLVELLVVMVIISILAMLLLPTLAQARESAKRSSCTGNMKQMALGAQLYALDGRYYPPAYTNWGGVKLRWMDYVAPYLKTGTDKSKVYVCPADINPGIPASTTMPLSYGINSYNFIGGTAGQRYSFWYPVHSSLVRHPSQVIVLTDARAAYYYVAGSAGNATRYYTPGAVVNAAPDTYVEFRHPHYTFTAGYADGHCNIRDRTSQIDWDASL